MNDQLVHNTTNNHPPKVVVLPNTFLQIILAAKRLVLHVYNCTSSNQQRRPLPLPFSIYNLLWGLVIMVRFLQVAEPVDDQVGEETADAQAAEVPVVDTVEARTEASYTRYTKKCIVLRKIHQPHLFFCSGCVNWKKVTHPCPPPPAFFFKPVWRIFRRICRQC